MKRGSLRVYLGAAPGVGKTFAMLNEGRRRAERGTDVVVGVVETHARPSTAAQMDGLEVLPRRRLEYRTATFEEMDVDAVLARRPEVALVDELAHTNAPGSRNEKRWQDIEELLVAGIDVISTVNIQHLESLNDVVARITGIVQRETVPDAWVRGAEQIELVDMTPEALRRRMAHGNVYPAERIDPALANYFRVGNLGALRELALLWVADRVDESLTDYRRRHGIDAPWETRERVVVALTGAPGGGQLVRRAARMALRARGELLGVHVRRDDATSAPPGDLLVRHRQLVEELGGRYLERAGSDVGRALLEVARAENATQIVLGASRRSRVAELLSGSIIAQVIRASGGIDVHVISTHASDGERALPRVSGLGRSLPARRRTAGLAIAVVGPPALSAVLVPLRDDLGLPSALLLFLLVVVASAAVGGALSAAVAVVAGFLLANWFFTHPVGALRIADAENVLALIVFAVVGAVVSAYVTVSARRTAEALRARAEATTLARLAVGEDTDPDRLAALLDHLCGAFAVDGASVVGRDESSAEWVPLASAGRAPPPAPDLSDETFGVPVTEGEALLLVAGEVDPADRAVLAAFAARVGDALDARRLSASAAAAADLAKVGELRAAILAAVSHDLRTPLSGIKASVTSLLADDVEWTAGDVRDFCEAIDDETDRLTALVSDLLDMSRITTGTVHASLSDVGLDEIVPAALASLGDRVRPGSVDVDTPETLPRARTDPALVERAVANLVANALTWSPDGQPVRVTAGVVPDAVVVRVMDRGPGIPVAERERIFEPFQRLGDSTAGSGVGLGLAVARGFVDAVGGELSIEDTPGGGTTMVISLPIADHP